MIERIEPWLEGLERQVVQLQTTLQEGRIMELVSMADRLHHLGYLLSDNDCPVSSLRRYQAVVTTWAHFRANMTTEFTQAMKEAAFRLLHDYETAVEFFCEDLVQHAVTRTDILVKVGELLTEFAAAAPAVPREAFDEVLLAGALGTEDIPERDLTDDLLSARRRLAVVQSEFDEVGESPGEPVAGPLRILDAKILGGIKRAVRAGDTGRADQTE